MAKSSKTVTAAGDPNEVPEGMDEAAYKQGRLDAKKAVETAELDPPPPPPQNPFTEESVVGKSWQAGFDAGPPEEPEPAI